MSSSISCTLTVVELQVPTELNGGLELDIWHLDWVRFQLN